MKIAFFGKSDVGLKRKKNEDLFLINPKLKFCIVADGMGGAAAGELASHMFVETVNEVFQEFSPRTDEETPDIIYHAFRLANERILDHVRDYPQHEGMGCTAELLSFSTQSYVFGHIGDSRTYLFRNNELKQLTHDHSLVQSLVDENLITNEEARHHYLRHVILRSVGTREQLVIDIGKGSLAEGDIFLLCSDGLTDMVDDAQIQSILATDSKLPHKAERLIEAALHNGGADNITVLLAQIR